MTRRAIARSRPSRPLDPLRAVGSLLAAAATIAACGGGENRPPDLLMITVDTLRADRLDSYGAGLGLTPNLDRLAAESLLFERAFAPAPFTLASVSALLTGRYPEEAGIDTNSSKLPDGLPTLATCLRQRGYRTAAVVSNYVLRRASGVDAGFEIFDDHFPSLEERRDLPERTATDTTDAALEVLRRLREASSDPVFLWVHYQDPHGPYTPPEGYRERNLERERARPDGSRRLRVSADDQGFGAIPRYQVVSEQREVAYYRAGYHGEIQHVDAEIGRLLKHAAKEGWLETTAVVFGADHGESLGERNHWFAHGNFLTDPLVRVPLLLRIPGVPASRRDDVASLIDLLPTLLSLGGGAPPQAHRGRDLLAPGAASQASEVYLTTRSEAVRLHSGLVTSDYKYVASLVGGRIREELYRPGDDAENLAAAEPARLEAMRNQLARIRESLARPDREPREALGAEERDRLRKLGYVYDD